jgi:hypothetical protein
MLGQEAAAIAEGFGFQQEVEVIAVASRRIGGLGLGAAKQAEVHLWGSLKVERGV